MVAFKQFASRARSMFNPAWVAALSACAAVVAVLSHPTGMNVTGLDFQKRPTAIGSKFALDYRPVASIRIKATPSAIYKEEEARRVHGLSGLAQPLRPVGARIRASDLD